MATEDIEVVIFRFTDAFPGFAVDRTVYKDLNSLVARMNNCAQKIEERLLIPPRMTIDLSYTYSPESRLIDLDVALHTLETIDANCYLHIVVAEDSLKYPQQGGADPFYHMHTVRDFITGTDGERLNDSVLAEGTDIHRNYAYTLQSKFKPEKIRIVVFVSEGIVGPVCQAEELVLVENIVTRVDELTPDTFRVHAPYPNPFNPVTTIEFTLPSESHVSLVMYDVLGRVVDIPVDRTLSTGTHRIVWDGRDRKGITLADGLYLFRLTAGNHIAHGKVTLLR
ncbi:Omp28-related outer membrane protein [bacterium]|nr:Omp28-related outer membrane protein [bacterium]